MLWRESDEPNQALLWIVSYIHFGQAGHIYQALVHATLPTTTQRRPRIKTLARLGALGG